MFSNDIYESILNDSEVWASEHTKNITSHLPIDFSQKDSLPETLRLVSALNSHKRTLQSIGLEHSEGDNFIIKGLERKFLHGVYLIYIQTKDGSLRKIPFVGHTPLKLPTLSNISNYTFALKAEKNQKNEREVIVTANLGYNCNDDSKNKSIEGADTLWILLIGCIYGVPEEYAKRAIKTDQLGNKYIFADEELLIHSCNPSKLLDDVLKTIPHACITLGRRKFNENGVLLIHIEFDNNLKPYLEIKEAINNMADIQQLKERFYQIAPKDWRQRLVAIDQYSILEDIDSLHYIHPLQ